MKQIIKVFIKLCLCIVAFFSVFSLRGQQFSWVKGGGTGQDLTTAYASEAVYSMCTDPNGNIYALSIVGNTSISADTFWRPSGAFGANNNIFVTSYSCNGQMRWAKLVASSGAACNAMAIKADKCIGTFHATAIINNTD